MDTDQHQEATNEGGTFRISKPASVMPDMQPRRDGGIR
jgi:hypothetical protein